MTRARSFLLAISAVSLSPSAAAAQPAATDLTVGAMKACLQKLQGTPEWGSASAETPTVVCAATHFGDVLKFRSKASGNQIEVQGRGLRANVYAITDGPKRLYYKVVDQDRQIALEWRDYGPKTRKTFTALEAPARENLQNGMAMLRYLYSPKGPWSGS